LQDGSSGDAELALLLLQHVTATKNESENLNISQPSLGGSDSLQQLAHRLARVNLHSHYTCGIKNHQPWELQQLVL